MWVGQKRLWWTSGETLPLFTPPPPPPLPHWPIDCSTVERVGSTKFLGVHITEDLTWTTNFMSLNKKGQQRLHFLRLTEKGKSPSTRSSPLSTGAPLRVCWPPASLSGTGTAVLLAARPYNGQLTLLQRSSVPLSPPSWIFSLHDAPAKPTASWRTPPTPPTTFSSSCHQVEGTGISKLALSDCSTAFPPGFESYYLQTPCSPLKPWTPQAPPLPATKTQRLNKIICLLVHCTTRSFCTMLCFPQNLFCTTI